MEPFFVIFLLFGAIAVGGWLINSANERKRTENWRDIATELGIDFLGEVNGILSDYGHLKTFRQGRNRRIRNAIAGDTGDVRITLADFRYRTGSGKNSHTHHRTICLLSSPRLNLPHCFLRPEVMFFDALGSLLGGQDIDFDHDPEFSKAWVLQGESETAIRRLFNDDVRAWFAAHKGRNFHFEADRDTLLFHTGKRRQPHEARDLMQQALEILNLLADAEATRSSAR